MSRAVGLSTSMSAATRQRDERGKCDNTLRGKALERATKAMVPTTLTPFEWEQWYAEHGVPDAHLNKEAEGGAWWRRLLAAWNRQDSTRE